MSRPPEHEDSATVSAPPGNEGDLVDQVGVRLEPGHPATTSLPVSAGIVHAGHALAAPLMLAADVASGVRLHGPEANAVLTTSFSFRRAGRPTPEGALVTATSTRLFSHNRRVVDSVTYTNDEADIVGFGQIGFLVRPSDSDTRDFSVHEAERRFLAPRGAPIPRPITEAAGIETIDAANGRTRLRLTPEVLRGGGILQGAFVTLMGEVAALLMGEHVLGGPTIVTALDAHYLAGVNAHAVTTGRWLGEPGAADVELTLRDPERDAVCATFHVRVQAP